MDWGGIVAVPAAKEICSLIRNRLLKRLDRAAPEWQPVLNRLEDYIVEVLQWSSRIQFFGMAEAEDTDAATIDLHLRTQPRRFLSLTSKHQSVGEMAVLTDPLHYVILGEPGSGKSTTLKRLARAILLSEPVSSSDIYRHPVIIRLREHSHTSNPDLVLADVLGVEYEERKIEEKSHFFTKGGQQLSAVLPKFLDAANAVLMLDGLDELPAETRAQFEKWAVELSYRLTESKILVTSRSGDFHRHLDGFNVLELCPLDANQTRLIAEKWLPNAGEFLALLTSLPYRDLADRPLLLSQLIVLFRRQGALPEQPSHIYRRLVRLLLEDWDKERGISRRTRYADFDPDRKMDFLGTLSYQLTYSLKATSFTLEDLTRVYNKIYQRYRLPKNEAREVAEEIASHSGLIAASGDGYEFSHLSFQEYLCATHLVREPFPDHLHVYIADYPAPLAIALTISANPSLWLAGLVLRKPFETFTWRSLQSFLARLELERPQFDVSLSLGIAAMHLHNISAGRPQLRDKINFLFEDPVVIESVRLALQILVVAADEPERPGEVLLRAVVPDFHFSLELDIPKLVSVPEHTLSYISRMYPDGQEV